MNFRSARSTRIAITELTTAANSVLIRSRGRNAVQCGGTPSPSPLAVLRLMTSSYSSAATVLVLDRRAFGGQAGASARIENYLGFPTGTTGMALMARAYNQAQKFGAEIAIPDEVNSLRAVGDPDEGAPNT
jgi:hypothetical protein